MRDAFRKKMNKLTIPFGVVIVFFFSLCLGNTVFATARESSITMTVTGGSQFIQLNPNSFGKSGNVSLDVSTDNFSGYILSIASTNGTNIVGTNGQITSIASALDETTFSTGNYPNKWGYKPSQHVVSNVNTPNTNYLPAPSAEGDQLAITNSANQASQADNYTVSFGVKISSDLPAGDYEYTYVLRAVANPIVYNITYDENIAETVTSMPVPNPQVIEIDGGTPVADSYGILSNAVPVVADMSFGGWCDVATTVNPVTHNYECSGTTYQPGAQFPIDQTADGSNIELYAIWIDDPFPIVWSQMGKCIFHGNEPSTITGNECTKYHNDIYIDTGIALNSQANASKDYEIHFTIDRYLPSENPSSKNDGQQTFVSNKVPSSTTIGSGTAPGLVVRRSSGDISFESKMNANSTGKQAFTATDVTEASIYRINNVLYVGINGGPLKLIQDITGYNQFFDLTTWFGGYPATSGCDGSQAKPCSTAKRFIEAEFSNMFIKLGDFDESNLHELTFIHNDGTQDTSTYLVVDGDSLATFPAVSKQDWIFGGWWTATTGGEQKTAPLTPTSNLTLYARWYKPVSEAQIVNPSINLAVSGTETIQITNSTDLEPYTFTSADSSVATVDSAGVITATGAGMTTITMTGSVTGDTQTIHVTVGSVISVTFDPDFGSAQTFTRDVVDGGSFGTLPDYTRIGYTLEGWYTGHGGTGTKLTTSTVFDSNTPTTYYANWSAVTYVCKLAKATTLHKDTCGQSTNNGCRAAGYASGADIYYGQAASSSTKTAGDAYDCDVNNDGTWDDETERFYYYGTENGNAKLIFYQSMINTDQIYTDAIGYLPTSATWSNPNLVSFTTGDFAGKVARFTTYQEALDLCGASNVNVSCQFMLEKSGFAYTQAQGYREGIWLAMDGSTPTRIQSKSRSLTHGGTTANAPKPTIEVPLEYIEPYTSPAATYEITFDAHNGETPSTVTINAGDTLGSNYPASDPLYTDHVFQGWYTAATGGSPINSSTQPAGDTTYHAQWKGTVALANITNTNINILESATETIEVTNAADIESYSFSTNDSNVAIVNATSGVVTGVGAGSTTITMTGASGATRTINVTVTTAPAATVTIHFNTHVTGVTEPDRTINLGDQIGTLPTAPAYDNNHLFQGWFTADTGGTQIDGTERPTTETTYHAQWKKTVSLAELQSDSFEIVEEDTATIVVNNASELEGYTFTSTNPSVASVDSTTGVITAHVESVTTITMTGTTSGQTKTINVRVVTESNPNVCVLASASTLHSVNNITYGQVATNPTPQAGDAYDCDVDYDGTYDPLTERFYYLGTDSNDDAVLIAYNSYYNGAWAPGTTSDSYYHYTDALSQLPSNAAGAWDNPNLIEQDTGKAARFATKSEVEGACPVADITTQNSLVNCPFFMEHTAYDSGGRSAYWLVIDGSTYWRVHAGSSNRNVASVGTPATSNNMARPAIVVPYDKIEKYVVPPVQTHTVTFNSMGGTAVSPGSVQVNTGDALGQNYPSTDPTKTNNKFFGWYTSTDYTTEVTPETTVNDDVTYYARWIGDTANFPIEFAEINECTFNHTSPISGTYCTQPKTLSYIDSGIKLFSASGLDANDQTPNIDKDFEVGFTIVEYNVSSQSENQASLVNSKLEATGYPGFVFRRNGNNYQLTAKFAGSQGSATPSDSITPPAPGTLKHVRIVKKNGRMYYGWNGGELTEWWNINGFSTTFETGLWFGAASNGSNQPWRQLVGKLTDMYVRLGTYEESGTYTITFDGRGGTPSEESRPVDVGHEVGTLPTVTRAGNYTFLGWLDENNNPVTASTVPTRSQTYHADWSYTSSDTPVVFDIENDPTKGYYTIINNWTNGPANITQFNKNTTTINNSTWGDTTVLSEAGFQDGLRANFEAYNCDMQREYNGSSESKWNWNSGNVNCSKPKVFDTGVSGALTVYLYDTTTSTLGNKVYYTNSTNGTLTNLVPGKTYKWIKDSDNTVYGYVTATAEHGTRFIDAGATNNVRDLGGLKVDTDNDGVIDGTLNYERLYRGGKVLGSTAGVEAITNLAKTSDNVAGNVIEYDVAGDQAANFPVARSYPVIHYDFEYKQDNMTNYNAARNAVTAMMNDIIAGNNIYFHCRVGADRTGTSAYLLEGLLGVPDEDRYREYELTHLGGLTDRTRYYKMKDANNAKKFVFMMDYVLTKQSIYNWYMAGSSDTVDSHPDQDRIDAFRLAMITPINANAGQGGGQGQTNSTSEPDSGQMQTNSVNNQNNGQSQSGTNSLNSVNMNSTNASNSDTVGKLETISNGSSSSDSTNGSETATTPLGVSAMEESDNSSLDTTGLAVAAAVAAMGGVGALTGALLREKNNG